ncbi:MAG: glycosyltransferase [Gammaproteobacteria bacterium]|nr:glycosyltransferase [Gammaproteobacteria bacterium]MBU1979936.1 glycosyltransferase [Gammaproteobacteria bacterium]
MNTADIAYTVALCTHNHAPRLACTLRALAGLIQPEQPWEFLVIDNASTDDTAAILADISWRFPGPEVRMVREEKLGLSNARNRAIAEARGEYIIFIDDDETPDPEWLRAHEGAIQQARPDALGGRIDVMFEDGRRPPWLADELLGFLGKLDHGGPQRQLTDPKTPIFGGNFGFKKNVFDKIGLFDAGLGRKGTDNTGGEDTEIYHRLLDAGCRVWWAPGAIINHRIQVGKLTRRYFLDLHYREGRTEGFRARGKRSRIPPLYLYPQLWHAIWNAFVVWRSGGHNATLRKEMNIAYFVGYILGWALGCVS